MRYSRNTRSLALIVAVLFFFAGPVQAYPDSQIIPSGKVKVYRDGKLIQELTEAAPLPKGAVLESEGNCSIRMDNLYFVAEDGAKFSVQNIDAATRLEIKSGTLYFAANNSTGPLVVETPTGVIKTEEIILQANSSTPGLLKGFVDVSGDAAKMGVLDGGSMVVSTPDGVASIASGKQITLSQAGLNKPVTAAPPPQAQQGTPQKPIESDDNIPAAYFIAGGAALLIGGTLYMINNQDDDTPGPASPATP